MTISVAHSFVSAKAQGADATIVSKNEWNASHTFTQATGALLGRTTAGAGSVEEITPNTTDFQLASTALALKNQLSYRLLTSDATGADSSTAQSVFVTTEDFTAEAAISYEIDAFYHITRSAGTTSHTTGVLFGGTATYTSIRYLAQVTNPTGNALGAVQQIVGEAATETVLTAANTSATENLMIKINGIIRVSGAGTVIPQFKYSAAPGGAPSIKANSYFKFRKLGTNVIESAGSWA
jgi:hypothetical protein